MSEPLGPTPIPIVTVCTYIYFVYDVNIIFTCKQLTNSCLTQALDSKRENRQDHCV